MGLALSKGKFTEQSSFAPDLEMTATVFAVPMEWIMKLLSCAMLLAVSALMESAAFAGPGHAVINSQRSSENNNVFVSQAVEGEYGHMNKIAAGLSPDQGENRVWQGYGFRNTVGVELLKFTQFSVSHSFVNMRSKASSLENLHGSRLAGEARVVFSSPIGNMEAGGGVTASTMDYTRLLENSDFLGSGYYYTLGLNYFLSQRVSVFGHGKMIRENLVRNGGSSQIENIKTKTNNAGIGFSLWL